MKKTFKLFLKKHPLKAYVVIAYGITWFCWITALIVSDKLGYILPVQDVFTKFIQSGFTDIYNILTSLIFMLGGFGPLIAALIVIWFESGSKGIAKLSGQIFRFRIGLHWYLKAVVIAVAIASVPFLLIVLTPLANFNIRDINILIPFIIPVLLWEIINSFGEEPGWRGFLLPRLQKRFDDERYIWLLGLIWAVWHYPYVVYHTVLSVGNMPVMGIVMITVFSLAGYTLSLIGQTYIYVWFYNNTKSVFLAVFFHGILNVITLIVATSMGGFNPTISLVMALMPWAVVIALTKIIGREKFPGHIHTTSSV